MFEYDVALKLLLQQSAAVALDQITGGGIARWLNVEFPEIRETRADLFGETENGELVHVELQSSHDANMAVRMIEYAASVYRMYRRIPRQVLIYVGDAPLRMPNELNGEGLSFRFRLLDARELDGERLLNSDQIGDNIIAILTRLPDHKAAVAQILGKIASLDVAAREVALRQLLLLSGLRQMEENIEEEARKMPVLNDLLDNKVLGREFKKGLEEGRQEGLHQGELTVLRRQIERRFGQIPSWADERLRNKSVAELESLSVRVLDAKTIEELLN